MATVEVPTLEDLRAEVEQFVDSYWSDTVTVRAWWRALADARLAMPQLPAPWGRGYDRERTRLVAQVLRDRDVLGPAGGIGTSLALPTILHCGTPEQIARFVPALIDGTDGWCQLFSEPGAGSDLASLQTKAVRDGDEWVVTGQKVWTSTGQFADYGILIARTDPDAPKHRGITYFVFPMRQPGVEIRPLVEMTGHAVFNEVFLDGARVPTSHVLGGLHDGWAVANTTLQHERAGIGGSDGSFSRAFPGSVAGHLDRPAASFLRTQRAVFGGGVGPGTLRRITDLARRADRLDDPRVRDRLAALHTQVELLRMTGVLAKANGTRTSVDGSLAKIAMTRAVQGARDLACELAGPAAQLGAADGPFDGWLAEYTLFSPAPGIYGGTDEIQRNIIGERGLGLPKEPGPDRDTPFKDLLVGTQR
jgi:alkylation response protein AidB-like acyl-CoA dehydrogenase